MGKVVGKDIKLKLGAVPTEKAILNPKLDQSADKIDVTDSMSAGDSREFMSGLISRGLTFSAWFRDDEEPLQIGDTSAFQLILGAKKISGNLVINSANLAGDMGDASKWDYSADITGAVTFGTAS